jgi:hypothetical protein
MNLDIYADIIPNQGLGGLQLRIPVRAIQELLDSLGVLREGSYQLVAPFEARYRLAGGAVEVAVDIRNGKVFKLIAHAGYKGALFGRVTVGMRVRDAIAVEPRLYYNPAEEFICCEGVSGLAIDLPVIDPLPREVPELIISSIAVYASEIATLQGQEGDW